MKLVDVKFLMIFLFVQVINSAPIPGNTHHHVHHRIHVPQKIRTIYRTKIIKVPEHHYHYHEKEKLVPIEVHKDDPVYPPLHEEEIGIHNHSPYDDEHNILKKHAPHYPKEIKKRKNSSKIK
ncbi:uncharacterized protein LOC130441224 [Diorhabda sublineata]|uniref:uncharacterized protein LOC130441224 n=1 Tax=Diorhabda sublineata TaxID=1163346 RepID=UPI0024E0C407|nr:uncharacterized protein LOC130441224 [Diorhabda sublineata]